MDKIKKNFGFGCMRFPMIGEEIDEAQDVYKRQVIATVAKVSRKRGLWLVVRVKKGDTRRYLHFYSFSSAASYVGMIQIKMCIRDRVKVTWYRARVPFLNCFPMF